MQKVVPRLIRLCRRVRVSVMSGRVAVRAGSKPPLEASLKRSPEHAGSPEGGWIGNLLPPL
ncbi:MAG TPA: hypothetical protein VKG21_05740 [Casimicrobiaceae bacterium]|nr:hypothetical protein [Casimicrobiaceae bacterium]